MNKKSFSRLLAFSAIAAVTIFAGKTYAESRQQLFAETPVAPRAVAQNVVSHEDSALPVSPVVPAVVLASTASEMHTVQTPQVALADTTANAADATTVVSHGTGASQHFSIKGSTGDDDDDENADNGGNAGGNDEGDD